MTEQNTPDMQKILVCLRAEETTPWKATNHFGVCAECDAAIQFRPHAPTDVRRMCVACFDKRKHPDDVYVVSAQTLAEVDALRRRN